MLSLPYLESSLLASFYSVRSITDMTTQLPISEELVPNKNEEHSRMSSRGKRHLDH